MSARLLDNNKKCIELSVHNTNDELFRFIFSVCCIVPSFQFEAVTDSATIPGRQRNRRQLSFIAKRFSGKGSTTTTTKKETKKDESIGGACQKDRCQLRYGDVRAQFVKTLQ